MYFQHILSFYSKEINQQSSSTSFQVRILNSAMNYADTIPASTTLKFYGGEHKQNTCFPGSHRSHPVEGVSEFPMKQWHVV